ncbi:MAG: preprotein translocase subunit SecG [Gammaproteobacteria bacterium]|nr:preprotein translocase subunit SecG [Gammaproteobacteria bacterium]
METLHTVLLIAQVLVAVFLIGFILIQHGRGADAGAAFGSGASATIFGARGSGNFFSRATAALALVFLANSLVLAWIATERVRSQTSLMDTVAPAAATETVAMPATESAQPAATQTAVANEAARIGDVAPTAEPGAASETAPAEEQSDIPAVPEQK